MALTFDAGASGEVANEILNALTQENVQCTMFLTGPFIKDYPDIVRRIVQEGHEIGNHTWSHPHLTNYEHDGNHNTTIISGGEFRKELRDTERVFRSVVGQNMFGFWRAPFGEHNDVLDRWATSCGYQHVGWTLDSYDWTEPGHTRYWESRPNKIISRVTRHVRENAQPVILMHLGASRNYGTLLPKLIRRLRGMGYEPVKVSEL